MKKIISVFMLFLMVQWTNGQSKKYDIVIYGGTSAGVAAALQSSRMGKSVVLIEPTNRIGGLTTGGLGQTDIGNKQAIGGISREFYENIKKYYDDPKNWKWEKNSEYMDGGQTRTEEGEATMWTFEPSAALAVYKAMMDKEKITMVYNERLNRESGVKKVDGRIASITMESGKTFKGKVFLDATYEGDLMASAGVSYSVGRESNEEYGETLNGVQANSINRALTGFVSKNAFNHNFIPGVDPYVVKGDPTSGLLPNVNEKPGLEGQGDKKIQAYCFRMCLTDHPDNRIPFQKPTNYDEVNYELLFRNYEARKGPIREMYSYGNSLLPWINSSMPNRKTDTNNKFGFSTDYIGRNYDYPEASYGEREKIIEDHRNYQMGLMWTLANHPRIPAEVREEASRWGTTKDEFERADGWQQQLYIREARRMISDYVMTQKNCEALDVAEDGIGLAAYGMDSHNVQRYVDANGYVQNEGNVEAHGFKPYPISYGSLVPKKEECQNLIVPVCVSSTHIAFGSIRMEPVFMVLGQSAATAAVMAIDGNTNVQEVPYPNLREQLLKDGQRLK
ncbi:MULTISPECIES: FAD-dependent oxidoreductase [unclassified Arenibacter]|uniref:FAD-dependent oxidoreductase n=1 Tax=unclassified Arenibacter TaxID=2615047 RepID=UPI000E348223|nr:MULTISPECIES: FAD-dependent oxidoreductase [unclassified Arenibacter]MCM4165559.1 xanthan lyase [Arenibacter sp. A80]RFT54712.1 FAD-dependent oxidoreductase [Arenibacter sp. P308M17]